MNLIRREILVVEDNLDDLLLVRRALQCHGAIVSHVETLDLALAFCSCKHPDAVLLDLNLPDCQGIDTFNRLRAAQPALPIVVLTGIEDETLCEQAIAAGAQDWFRKDDVHPRLLLRVLVHACQRQALVVALKASEVLAKANETQARNDRAAMERTLAIVSHDLRAPLLGIRACIASLIDNREVTTSGQPLCDAIGKEAGHLIELATNLIDVDRITHGNMHWYWDGADPSQVVKDVTNSLHSLAEAAGTHLTVGAVSATQIHGDGSACRRLITNLVSNAIRHSGASNIEVSCTRDGDSAEFVVADDGRGINPAVKGRLGRPFEATEEDNPRGGVGLGLAISLGIAAAHGGYISIRSRLGKGTSVKVVLRDLAIPRALLGAEKFQELDLA